MSRYLRPFLIVTALLFGSSALAQVIDRTPAPVIETEEPQPGPPPPLPDLSDPNTRSAESLAEPGIDSPIPKSLRNSGTKAGGPANDLNPSGRREAPLPGGSPLDAATGRDLYHGNYCGVGQRGEGLPPTDALDAACQRHDSCYATAGYRSCACDKTLKLEAAIVSERPTVSLQVRQRALSVAEAAEVMQCQTP
ncbi:MAG: hypothetical protein K2Y56_21540 [Methylobacterium sp.]|uniref:phospholipase A2 family protein n=1 Tax=Methylobacterium sp. TaxID=409 RepID=UPI0025EE27FD|nr:phospholipase A2 family protein [Methylobacterium sp.]MBX9934067.1 hypothetical protein [Methylobacterium sp.]